MNKTISFVLLSAVLGGCAMTQSPEEAFSPSAFIGVQTARCERDARVAATTSPGYPTSGNNARGDLDTARDINRNVYYHCTTALPATR